VQIFSKIREGYFYNCLTLADLRKNDPLDFSFPNHTFLLTFLHSALETYQSSLSTLILNKAARFRPSRNVGFFAITGRIYTDHFVMHSGLKLI
jgi:hypothetical protein